MANEVVDLIVEVGNPDALDRTIQALGGCAAHVVDGSWNGATCRVRVFGGLGFLKFAMERQGYGRIVGEEAVP